MVLSELMLCTCSAIVKYVSDWPMQRMMFIRFTLDFALCATAGIAYRVKFPNFRVMVLLVVRGAAYCIALLFLWSALRCCVPMGDTSAILMLNPMWLAILARITLGEKMQGKAPLQLVMCLFGAVLINKPLALDRACPASNMLTALFSSISFAVMNLLSRYVKEVPSLIVQGTNDVVIIVFAASQAISGDGLEILVPPMDRNCVIVLFGACIGFLGLWCNVKGYQTVEVAVMAGFAGYTSLPFAYLLQVVVFGTLPDGLSMLGASLIVITNALVYLDRYRSPAGEGELKEPLVAGEKALGADAAEKGASSGPEACMKDELLGA